MKKKLWMTMVIFAGMCLMTACSEKENNQENSSTSAADSSVLETEYHDIGNAVADSRGVWAYSQILLYHASDNKRYLLEESPDGTVKDKNNKSYSFQEYDNRVFAITPSGDKLIVKEGKYSEENIGSKDSPDGYKLMMITYKKSDLFDLDALEQAITGKVPEAEKKGSESTTESQSDTDSASDTVSDSESEKNSESSESSATDPATEEDTTETEKETEDNSVSAEMPATEENAVYAEIYQDITDFMLTDNFKQKDPSNRALELFNHLHNLGHANIDQDSITNDTEKQEVRFYCYEKYMITVNVADSVITVSEEES